MAANPTRNPGFVKSRLCGLICAQDTMRTLRVFQSMPLHGVEGAHAPLPEADGQCERTASLAARPQMICSGGQWRNIWPEYWGITVKQFRALIEECKKDPRWNRANSVRTLVEDYVKPKTAGKGVGYALHVNGNQPREVNVLVSHSWNENAEEFLETLERSVRSYDSLFICALALYQCGDGFGPSISEQIGSSVQTDPFHRVLLHIAKRGRESGCWWWPMSNPMEVPLGIVVLAFMVLVISMSIKGDDFVPNFDGTVERYDHNCDCWKTEQTVDFGGIFLPLDVGIAVFGLVVFMMTWWMEIYVGRMLAVPNREDDLYMRLWCVYEIYSAKAIAHVPVSLAHTSASAGSSRCELAQCSSQEDASRIRKEIEEFGRRAAMNPEEGYKLVDLCIKATNWRARFTLFIRFAFVFLIACVVSPGHSTLDTNLATAAGHWGALLLWFSTMAYSAARVQGHFTCRQIVFTCTFYVAMIVCAFLASEAYTTANELDKFLSAFSEALGFLTFFTLPFFMLLIISQLCVGVRGPWRTITVVLLAVVGCVASLVNSKTRTEFGEKIQLGNLDELYPSLITAFKWLVHGPVIFAYCGWLLIHWGCQWDESGFSRDSTQVPATTDDRKNEVGANSDEGNVEAEDIDV